MNNKGHNKVISQTLDIIDHNKCAADIVQCNYGGNNVYISYDEKENIVYINEKMTTQRSSRLHAKYYYDKDQQQKIFEVYCKKYAKSIY